MNQNDELKPGRYRHYKGNEYVLLGIATHSETEEKLVVYRPDYGDRGLWVRPLSMFAESVNVDGRWVPRFEFLGAAEPECRSSAKQVMGD